MRIGQGVDIHPFSNNPHRPMVLGGVTIPGVSGLDGHSDADVVAHACADALLGAAQLGDIGQHFPDTDERFAGADSLTLLRLVLEMVQEKQFRVVNVDATIVAEAPRLAPYVGTMQEKLGEVLSAPVSVKATRAEGLGALGRAEGIMCMAVALIEESGNS